MHDNDQLCCRKHAYTRIASRSGFIRLSRSTCCTAVLARLIRNSQNSAHIGDDGSDKRRHVGRPSLAGRGEWSGHSESTACIIVHEAITKVGRQYLLPPIRCRRQEGRQVGLVQKFAQGHHSVLRRLMTLSLVEQDRIRASQIRASNFTDPTLADIAAGGGRETPSLQQRMTLASITSISKAEMNRLANGFRRLGLRCLGLSGGCFPGRRNSGMRRPFPTALRTARSLRESRPGILGRRNCYAKRAGDHRIGLFSPLRHCAVRLRRRRRRIRLRRLRPGRGFTAHPLGAVSATQEGRRVQQ